jgi:hypothetical protein
MRISAPMHAHGQPWYAAPGATCKNEAQLPDTLPFLGIRSLLQVADATPAVPANTTELPPPPEWCVAM